jgi:hypothetical protein
LLIRYLVLVLVMGVEIRMGIGMGMGRKDWLGKGQVSRGVRS